MGARGPPPACRHACPTRLSCPAVPFLGDAVSYLVSAGTVRRIRGHFRPDRTGEHTGLWREVTDGIRLVWNHALRAVVIRAALVNFAFNRMVFTITVTLRQHGTAAGIIRLAQAGIAAGGLLGALGGQPGHSPPS
jgi:hypothetical protein